MSKEPEEPVVSLSLDDDDIAGYREQRANRPKLKDIDSAPGSGASRGLVLLLFVLLLLLGAANFMMYREMVADREAYQRTITTEQNRIAALERAMSATGANISATENVVQTGLKELDSEVRKLWDNVWKKASARLDEHDQQIAALQTQAKGAGADAAAAKKALEAEVAARTALQTTVSGLQGVIGEIDALGKSVKSQTERVAALDKQFQAAAGSADSPGARIASLEARVAENEEWIKSNNAFRRQVIKDIRYLKRTVAELRGHHPDKAETEAE